MRFHRVTGVGRDLIYDPVAERLAQIPDRLINFLPGHVDELVVIVAVVCWLALAVTAARGDETREPSPHVWGPELCFFAALALYLLCPRSMQRPFYWHMINGRFVVAIALFASLMLRGPIVGRRRWLMAPVVVATAIYAIALCGAFREFNRHAAGFDEVVAQIPRGKQVLTLVLRPMGDSTVNVSAFNQWPSYVQLRHGGYNFYNFAEGFPLRVPRAPAGAGVVAHGPVRLEDAFGAVRLFSDLPRGLGVFADEAAARRRQGAARRRERRVAAVRKDRELSCVSRQTRRRGRRSRASRSAPAIRCRRG